MKYPDREFIICAAIHVKSSGTYKDQPVNIHDGFVISGRRHYDCYNTISNIISHAIHKNYITTDISDVVNKIQSITYRENQGFITSKNRFVSRKLAFKIAKGQGQINFGPCKGDEDSYIGELISEELYYP